MLRKFRQVIASLTKKWSLPSRWPVLVFVLLLALVIGSAAPAQTAGAQANTVYAAARIQISGLPIYGSGSLTICKGEKVTRTALIRMWLGRIPAIINFSGQSAVGQLISASSSNTQVAAVSPGTSVTGVNPSTNSASTQFTIKGVDVGSTLITFSDGGSLSTNASYNRPRADPRFLHVDVKECAFEVTAVSKWTIPEGFNLKLSSQFSWLIKPGQDGKFDERDVLVSNTAELGFTVFARPMVTHEVSAFASTVRIYGEVDWDASEIGMLFSYEPVSGKMFIDCKACEPYEPYIGQAVEAGHSGFGGTPYSEGAVGSTAGFSITKPHELEYLNRFGGLSYTTGTITITVVRIYR